LSASPPHSMDINWYSKNCYSMTFCCNCALPRLQFLGQCTLLHHLGRFIYKEFRQLRIRETLKLPSGISVSWSPPVFGPMNSWQD
jgi:hypothetical protein